ncbi:hypothetical protein VE01_05911 [Pseudogymnoascus verrucosus]|uniref:Uncharacterized protein n=1 Tax=Pseudogymnoascus verrucosus TaxID=342668 RepID=A0A1B8GIK3_9PEZI|nr:uncharacterized protein VE01_05911 [Pseudogymnoascus verrucosus]OBT95626.1 hypothetical protein VE01_05911 [Pseudogymnoascus verrucosus]
MTTTTTSPPPSTNTTIPRTLLALTTPFILPPSCTNIFTTTSTITSYHWNNFTATTLIVVYSDPANARFTQCQPPGWDQIAPSSRFHFSPAVCPDQWTAYAVRDLDVDIDTSSLSSLVTTAYCCASGYTLGNPGVTLQSLDNAAACVSAIGVTSPSTTSTSSTLSTGQTPHATPYPYGIQIHNAYQITWASSDKPTLSPTPPDFSSGCSATLSKWVPGEPVGAMECNNRSDGGGAGRAGWMVFIMVGVPVIVVVFVASWCVYCYRSSKKKWRAEDEARRRRDGVGAGVGREAVVDELGERGGDIKT